MTVEAGVIADLVASMVYASKQGLDPWIAQRVETVECRLVLCGQEVEGADDPVLFAHVHQEVEGVVRVQAVVTAAYPAPRAQSPNDEPRVAANQRVGPELPHQPGDATPK